MKNWQAYFQITRLDKPIGILLLLWPTLVALWIASNGKPQFSILLIFILGVVLTRSAGCILNDVADKKFDGKVARTHNRPLVTKKLSTKSALVLCAILLLCAFGLVLFLNKFTILLSFVAVVLTALYPLTKRITYLPQLMLGFTFNFGVLMAFTAVQNKISLIAIFLYFITIIWTVVYDTMYAMVDREDDLKIGVKSTAILFGSLDKIILATLQIIILGLLVILGYGLHFHFFYYVSICLTAGCFIYQQYLLQQQQACAYFKAFLHNHWAWLSVFIGIILNYSHFFR